MTMEMFKWVILSVVLFWKKNNMRSVSFFISNIVEKIFFE